MNNNDIDFDKLYSYDPTAGDLLVDMLGTADRIDKEDCFAALKVDETGQLQIVKDMIASIAPVIAKSIDGITQENSTVEIGKLKLALLDMQDVFSKLGFDTVSRTRQNIGETMNESIEFDPNEIDLGALADKLKSVIVTIQLNFKD